MITEKELKINWSYSIDVPEWLRKIKNISSSNVIVCILKQTPSAIQVKELFGYQRIIWFPRSQISLTPQISIETVKG